MGVIHKYPTFHDNDLQDNHGKNLYKDRSYEAAIKKKKCVQGKDYSSSCGEKSQHHLSRFYSVITVILTPPMVAL